MVERTTIINEITMEELKAEIITAFKNELSTLLKEYKIENPDELLSKW